MWKGVLLIVFYLALVLAPLALVAVYTPPSHHRFIYEIGRGFALIGFVLLCLQPILAARIKWIERPFGLDILIRYHKYMAVFAVILLVWHPFLLAFGGASWLLSNTWNVPWYIWVGRTALAVLLVNVFLSLFQSPVRLKFEKWRLIHDVLSPSLLVLAFVHSLVAGDDIKVPAVRWLWVGMLGLAMVIFVYHRFLRPMQLRRRPFRVIDVRQEKERVWTIKLTPPEGRKRYKYLPGQFHFLTFHRGRDLPVEEHHWTISSSPAAEAYVSSTIKELGDFTATIGKTRPGDTATVHGPFGRFSYVLHPEERDLVFIAGGIGITPLMSMLRHMRDTGCSTPVLLIYANRSEQEIVFDKELLEIEKRGHPALKVVHVLSGPGKQWSGESGHIDREKIKRFCGENLSGKAFYVCGPPGMVKATVQSLKDLGVADSRMHQEIFSFLN